MFQGARPDDLPSLIARCGLTPYDSPLLNSTPGSDNSAAWNDVIDRVITAGGGAVILPPGPGGDWKLGSSLEIHKAGVNGLNLNIFGLGQKCRVGWLGSAGDAFIVGNGTDPVYYVDISDIYLYAAGAPRTSGFDFKFTKANIMNLSGIVTDGTYAGFYGQDLNSVYGRLIQFNMPNQTSGAGVTIFSDPAGSGRTDIVKFEELTVQAYNAGSYGMVVNGRVYGVHTDGAYMLGTRRGLQVISSAAGLADIPSFCEFRKFETDRALDISVTLEQCYRTEFSRGEISNTSGAMDVPHPQGSNDASALFVGPGCVDLKFIGGRIGGSRQQAAVLGGKNMKFMATSFYDFAKQGPNLFAGIYLPATANGFNLRDCTIEGFGRASYAVQMEPGTSNGLIDGTLYNGTVSGYVAGTGTNVTNTNQKLVTYTEAARAIVSPRRVNGPT